MNMSVDTYFCFCCLSTTNLTNLFDDGTTNQADYATLLKTICSVSACKVQYQDDSYICDICIKKLTDAELFRQQVFETLNVLQVTGLIKTKKTKGDYILVTKAIKDHNVSDDDNKPDKKLLEVHIKLEGLENRPIFLEEHIEEDVNENITKQELEVKPFGAIKVEYNNLEADSLRSIEKKPNKYTLRKRERYRAQIPYKINKDFICDLCKQQLPNQTMYHRHMNSHFPNFVCDQCGKSYSSQNKLKQHSVSHRDVVYECVHCKKTFTKYNTYCSHRSMCNRDMKRYRCPLCGEKFVSYNRRMSHLAEKHGETEKKFKCNLCPSEFRLQADRTVHMKRKHLNIKHYFCDICKVGFFDKDDLRSHMICHTGLKDFPCTLCPKKYTRKKALMVHMKIHNADRRFGCDRCGKMFLQKCTLQLHLRTHDKEHKTIKL